MTLIKDLTEDTSPEATDLLLSTKDPDGTPLDRSVEIQSILEMVPAVNFVDRGNTAAVDFDAGDLTDDGTFNELDLSSIVPAGATWVLLRCQINHSVVNFGLFFRKGGATTGAGECAGIRTQDANVTNMGNLLVALDSN